MDIDPTETYDVTNPSEENGDVSTKHEKAADGTAPPINNSLLLELLEVAKDIREQLIILNRSNEPLSASEFVIDPSITPDISSLPAWITENFRGSEQIIAVSRKHWIITVPPILALLATSIIIWSLYFTYTFGSGVIFLFCLTLWLVSAVWPVIAFVKIKRHALVWSDSRILRYQGIFSIKVSTIPYYQVTDFNYERPLLGRLFGYGHAIVETAGQDQAIQREVMLAGAKRDFVYVDSLVSAKKPH